MNVISKRLMTAVAIAVAVALGMAGTVVPANATPVSVSTESPKGEDKGTETQGEQVGGKQPKVVQAVELYCLINAAACLQAGVAVAAFVHQLWPKESTCRTVTDYIRNKEGQVIRSISVRVCS